MADPVPSPTPREQRLAAKLRENLHRRKAQARALGADEAAATDGGGSGGGSGGDAPPALSKAPPSG